MQPRPRRLGTAQSHGRSPTHRHWPYLAWTRPQRRFRETPGMVCSGPGQTPAVQAVLQPSRSIATGDAILAPAGGQGRGHDLHDAAGWSRVLRVRTLPAVCRGGEPYQKQGTTFARRPDGVLVSVASETLFQFVNQVAAAVAKKYPKTLVGCYAYSAYSHPPSFKLHPNVFLQTTTAFRRTPLSLAEQLETFHKIGVQAGIRAYYSVYQWDWDYPAIIKGEMMLPRLVDDLRFYYLHNVQSVNAEASCNWAARGLGYYLAARLMWNVREDPQTILADFYDKAFGPAALPMERYYVRWLGRGAAIRTRPTATKSSTTAPADPKTVKDELDNADEAAGKKFSLESLKAAYRDLDEAARLVTDRTEYRARVDQLRLYAHYLYLRTRVEDAAGTRKKEKVIAAVKDETVF